ncbi:MAG: transporter, partial [Alphaproteobacteria bacterium]|nr:transporter [Alphaproteobacteria bacterium]
MKSLLALGLTASLLAGCTLEPHYVRPNPAIPPSWPTGAAYPAPTKAAPLPSVSYPDIFRDPHLQAVIAEALAHAQNLRIAMANVQISHAEYVVQRADL